MSQPPSISDFVHSRFREILGPPHKTLGRDHHWRFQSSTDKTPIDVLVNGTTDTAAIWIFTHQRDDGVITACVTHEGEIESVIKQVLQRVKLPPESTSDRELQNSDA